ncbi:MAG: hypothetical protein JNK10_10740 [Cyclobacteriaceae bacterium]|nr:hypothetical protein [Cyclobacteriaceae bacterium]
MRTRSQPSTLLIVLILFITFPIWITVGAVLFGVFAGVFGAIFGILGAIFGVLITVLMLPFKILFGWGDWGFHGWNGMFHGHNNGLAVILIIIVVAILLRRNRSTN